MNSGNLHMFRAPQKIDIHKARTHTHAFTTSPHPHCRTSSHPYILASSNHRAPAHPHFRTSTRASTCTSSRPYMRASSCTHTRASAHSYSRTSSHPTSSIQNIRILFKMPAVLEAIALVRVLVTRVLTAPRPWKSSLVAFSAAMTLFKPTFTASCISFKRTTLLTSSQSHFLTSRHPPVLTSEHPHSLTS